MRRKNDICLHYQGRGKPTSLDHYNALRFKDAESWFGEAASAESLEREACMTTLWSCLQARKAEFVGTLPESRPATVSEELLRSLCLSDPKGKNYQALAKCVQSAGVTVKVMIPAARSAGLTPRRQNTYSEAAWLMLLFRTFGAERAPTASDDGTIVWKQWEGWVAAG